MMTSGHGDAFRITGPHVFIMEVSWWHQDMEKLSTLLALMCLLWKSHDDIRTWRSFPHYWPSCVYHGRVMMTSGHGEAFHITGPHVFIMEESWWHQDMEKLSTLLAFTGNLLGDSLHKGLIMWTFDVSLILLNKLLNKHSIGWWSGTQWRLTWHHCNSISLVDEQKFS